MRRAIFAPLALILLPLTFLLGACAPSVSGQDTLPRGEGYDFLVLALTWSPSYCEIEGEDANRQQCANGRDLGFVVHGLWPQFESGWPEYCQGNGPNRVPNALVRQYLDLMPSAGLMGHQWRKHGSCTGLDQDDYFRLVRAARERIAIPDRFGSLPQDIAVSPEKVETEFVAANPGMRADGIAVSCERRHLSEVRICLNNDLEFRSCPEIDVRGCRLPQATMPAPG